MRDRISKRLQLIIGKGELRSALQHALLKRAIECQNFVLLLPAFCDVTLNGHPVGHLTGFVQHRYHVDFQPDGLPGFRADCQLAAHGLGGSHSPINALELGGIALRPANENRSAAQHFVSAVAGGARKGVVDKNDRRAVFVNCHALHDDDHVVKPRNRKLQQAQLGLLGAAFGDVLKSALQPHNDARLVAHRLADGMHPDLAAFGRALGQHKFVGCAVLRAGLHQGCHHGPVLRQKKSNAFVQGWLVASGYVVNRAVFVRPAQHALRQVNGPGTKACQAPGHPQHRHFLVLQMLGLLELINVRETADPLKRRAVAVALLLGAAQHPAVSTISPAQTAFGFERFGVQQRLLEVLQKKRAVGGVQRIAPAVAKALYSRQSCVAEPFFVEPVQVAIRPGRPHHVGQRVCKVLKHAG